MTPNKSHVAGLELAKKAMEQQRERYGCVHKASLACLDGLIEIAKSAPAEAAQAAVKDSLTAQPVAYAAFADNGNIRMWCRSAIGMCELLDEHGNKAVPLYTSPPSPDAELVELLRSKFPRIDPCKPVPLDEKAHCCEYTIYVERERLHRMIDAKLASREVKP